MKALLILLASLFWSNDALRIEYGPWVTRVGETEFTVLWTTPVSALCHVELAPDDGLDFSAVERQCFYQTVAGRSVYTRFHCVRVTGLQPGTKYRYRIVGQLVKDASSAYHTEYGDSPVYVSEATVKTFDSTVSTCSFSQLNDIHFDAARYTQLLAGKTPEDMDFLLLNGDIVSYAQSIDSVVKYTFQPAGELISNVPLVFARGNHESRGVDFDKVPALFPSTTGEFYYQFRQGPVAFLVLDGGEDKPDSALEYSGYAHFDEYRAAELEWLKTAVKDPSFVSAPLKVVLVHMPILDNPNSWHGQKWMAKNFIPVLNEAGVDLCLSAHYHSYNPEEARADGNHFPVIVNSNMERLDFHATSTAAETSYELSIYDVSGNLVHSYAQKKRNPVRSNRR